MNQYIWKGIDVSALTLSRFDNSINKLESDANDASRDVAFILHYIVADNAIISHHNRRSYSSTY